MELAEAVWTDWAFASTLRLFEARGRRPVYEFHFGQPEPPGLGSNHAPTCRSCATTWRPCAVSGWRESARFRRSQELATQMHEAPAAYAREGDPGWLMIRRDRPLDHGVRHGQHLENDPVAKRAQAWKGRRHRSRHPRGHPGQGARPRHGRFFGVQLFVNIANGGAANSLVPNLIARSSPTTRSRSSASSVRSPPWRWSPSRLGSARTARSRLGRRCRGSSPGRRPGAGHPRPRHRGLGGPDPRGRGPGLVVHSMTSGPISAIVPDRAPSPDAARSRLREAGDLRRRSDRGGHRLRSSCRPSRSASSSSPSSPAAASRSRSRRDREPSDAPAPENASRGRRRSGRSSSTHASTPTSSGRSPG